MGRVTGKFCKKQIAALQKKILAKGQLTVQPTRLWTMSTLLPNPNHVHPLPGACAMTSNPPKYAPVAWQDLLATDLSMINQTQQLFPERNHAP